MTFLQYTYLIAYRYGHAYNPRRRYSYIAYRLEGINCVAIRDGTWISKRGGYRITGKDGEDGAPEHDRRNLR